MKKTILIIILSILTLFFLSLIVNAYNLQKRYIDSKNTSQTKTEETNDSLEAENKPSIYKDYTKEEYENALKNKQVIFLYFTSNWCAQCIEQDKLNLELFSELTTLGVVGLKIHILDSETTTETDALAKKFDVTKEQSFVLLNKLGAVHFKQVGKFEKESLKQKILEIR
jgi:thiol:disulfide interchange protein